MMKKTTALVGTMAIGIFLCILDTTVMNIALPAIQNGLSTSLEQLSWALNLYTILFATLTIPLGRLADIYGRHRFYLIGLSLFLLGSLFSGLAGSVTWLIVGRGIQSLGAAIVFPASMTIGIQSVPMAKRTSAIATLGVTQGLAAAMGPTIGGVVTQFFSWRGIFLVNVPFTLLALVLCWRLFDLHERKQQKEQLDMGGTILSMTMLFSLTLFLVKGNDWGWTSYQCLGLILLSVLSLIGFIVVESHVQQPMVPLALFKDKQFVGSAIVTIMSGIFLVALLVLMPSFFTKVQGKGELLAALMITPASMMIFIWSPISGWLLGKVGPRLVILMGSLSMIGGYVALSWMNPNIYWQVCVAALLVGMGYGVVIGPITVLAAGDFTGNLLTASQSVIGVFRQIGTSLAVAIFVSALSANLVTAKTNVWLYSQNRVEALPVSAKVKSDTLTQVKSQLATEQTPKHGQTTFISSAKTQRLIRSNYQRTLRQHQLTAAPVTVKRVIYQRVSQSVTQQVTRDNQLLTTEVAAIRHETKRQLTHAFIRPYQMAMPFTGVMLLTVFLFRKRSDYLRKEEK
ncbi:MFS transporter [Levilactobacillus tujiorum]|uniref:MFS transporter n=1 Tax=Levilactobacillus tujiorum TaxID=2912243 RepID=A0ABX1L2U3_9LACO|nr:MFS transporter [Levilactobacillus tujiorum]MCH5463655.1 MFS transporter [Levilactobacillus tujiorum]NLR10859.1 MFS transporter [Lactobacillus sp. HBUAS51387]NLR28641.1 MFS transporter [Levilactobacillus tujiorum]